MPSLKLSSLGELNAVGERNCLSLEHRKGTVLLDFGTKVPSGSQTNAEDGLLPIEFYPDMEKVEQLARDGLLLGILESHGHLDHVGGFDRLFEEGLSSPVFGSHFTLEVIVQKILRGRVAGLRDINGNIDDYFNLGPFEISRFPALHSIPGSSGFLISADDINVVYTGDIKTGAKSGLDAKYGYYLDTLREMASWAEEINYLILDATNVPEEGYAGVEETVSGGLERVFKENETGRIFVSFISSNVLRAKNIMEIARRHDRPVYVAGTAIRQMLEIANKLRGWNIFNQFSDALPENAVVLATGSQGEFGSFLDSLSKGTLKMELEISPKDTLVIASDTIPTEEIEANFKIMATSLSGIFSKMYVTNDTPVFQSRGAEVKRRGDLHVSGHAKKGDLREIISALNPRVVIPYHAELERRQKMAEFVKDEFNLESVIMEQEKVFDLTL